MYIHIYVCTLYTSISPMRKVGSSNPSRVKPMTNKIDNFSLPVLSINKIGQGLVDSVSGYYDRVGYHVMVLGALSPSGAEL